MPPFIFETGALDYCGSALLEVKKLSSSSNLFLEMMLFSFLCSLFNVFSTVSGYPPTADAFTLSEGEFSGCHFPETIQGLYKRQDESRPPRFLDSGQRYPIEYLEYYVGPTSIPHWGDCYQQIGNSNSYILGVKKVGGFMCYRCFTLIQRSFNVLQVVTKDENQCHKSVETAKDFCLKPQLVDPADGIVLWKAEDIVYQYCPVAGRAKLSFKAAGNHLRCSYSSSTVSSTISNCQRGYEMDISFRGCSFPNQDMTLRCLGTWDAERGNGEMYFAVYNREVKEYRCGLYKDKRSNNGFAVAALSNDSTCTHLLNNSTDGFEQFVFYYEELPEWPLESSECVFPKWLHGDWELLTVRPDIMSYYHHNDPTTMMTQYAKCVGIRDDKIRLFSRNHCGDTLGYHCLWAKRRSESVVEFKMGGVVLKHDDNLFCNDPAVYANSSWNTVAVRKPVKVVPCSHPGHFMTPLSMHGPANYCFNVTIDCRTQYYMKTIGYVCNTNTVFDTRQYRCIASWEESGLHFSYAKHLDSDIKGCFVSKIVNGQLFMVWTGKKCERDLDFDKLQEEKDSETNLFVLQQSEFCQGQTLPTPGTRAPPVKTTKPDIFDDESFPRNVRKYPPNSSNSRKSVSFLTVLLKVLLFYIINVFKGLS